MKQSAHLPRMWLRRVVMVLPLVLLTPACGNHAATAPPTAPTAIPAPTPTPPSPSSIHVTGTVIDDTDAPVPGATVTVTPWIGAPATPGHYDPPVSAVTDGIGSYSLAVQSTRDAVGGIGHVRIDKMGYETVSLWDFVVPSGAQVPAIAYQLTGGSVSDPIGPAAADPAEEPMYPCPGDPAVNCYCFPDGTYSAIPYEVSPNPQ